MEKNIGSFIRKRRLELKLTMKQVAASCDVSESTVSRWETGEIDNIKRGSIYLLSKALYLPIETILGIESDKKIINAEVIIKMNKLESKLLDCTIEELNQIEKFIDTFVLNNRK